MDEDRKNIGYVNKVTGCQLLVTGNWALETKK